MMVGDSDRDLGKCFALVQPQKPGLAPGVLVAPAKATGMEGAKRTLVSVPVNTCRTKKNQGKYAGGLWWLC